MVVSFHLHGLRIWPLVHFLILILALSTVATGENTSSSNHTVSVMAYYYIWFDGQSWNRAKTDYPMLGRYASDDRNILATHMKWAKDVGIDGFIVSWKSTFKLDRNLEELIAVAAAHNFKLWIMYQGLDFNRKPLSTDQISADFAYFIKHYASNPVFQMYDRPVVVWSGTWEFSPEEIDEVTISYRERLTILATERDIARYRTIAVRVDGNAYYWSSVNPESDVNYAHKIKAMGKAVREKDGMWVAPAAPGFDARHLGGRRMVERKDGKTLRHQMSVALRSDPDVIGIISWNEFSENTHIEPSKNYGTQALDVLADMQKGVAPKILDVDIGAHEATTQNDYYSIYVLGGLLALFALSVVFLMLRSVVFRRPEK